VFWPGGFREAQVVALIIMALSLYGMNTDTTNRVIVGCLCQTLSDFDLIGFLHPDGARLDRVVDLVNDG
jgi:hypothetical protein